MRKFPSAAAERDKLCLINTHTHTHTRATGLQGGKDSPARRHDRRTEPTQVLCRAWLPKSWLTDSKSPWSCHWKPGEARARREREE
ncbi:uncharacterized protein LY79DRAFT_267155 [Colletotrichum navitas]|uniref:Uncharacterized protein n=1 Tax=Colletotrichum navitas TaxID=681940 RepID=A0AAD8V1Q3_9PEZI|nr:uncharacterized protein LY79DRAFT_267155 [Colletotrichum navitas]KAK1585591.1 hypothetical protein LY79DRAFT_267155 [Colletotrichum navitas]